jgi:O-antigen/teichoic acid export membrane protein
MPDRAWHDGVRATLRPRTPLALVTRLTGAVRGDGLVRNSGWLIATTIGNLALGYLYWIVAARLLSHEALGIGTALVSLMNVATVVFALGLGPVLIATLPAAARGRPWATAVNAALLMAAAIALVTSIAMSLVLPAWSTAFAPLGLHPLSVVFVAVSAVWTVCTILDYVFVAERRSSLVFVRNMSFSVVRVPALMVGTALAPSGATVLLASWGASAVASFALGLVVLIYAVERDYRPVLAGTRRAAKFLRADFAGHHLASVGGQVPIFVLPALVAARLGPGESAYFYITWAAAGVFFIVSPAVAASLFAEAEHDPRGLGRAVRRSAWTIAALLTPASLVFLAFGRPIMGLFGPSYPDHTLPVLLPLILSAVPDAITNIYVTVLRVRRRLGLAAALNLGIGLTALALAWVLLPPMGIAGAAWAWLSAQAAGALVVAGELAMHRRRAGRARYVRRSDR